MLIFRIVSATTFTQAQSDEIGQFVRLERDYFKSFNDEEGLGTFFLENAKSSLEVDKSICAKMLAYCDNVSAQLLIVFSDVLATTPPGHNVNLQGEVKGAIYKMKSAITVAQKYVDTALVDCDKLIDMDNDVRDKLFDHVSSSVNKSVYDCIHDLSAASSSLKTDAKDAVRDWVDLIDNDALSYDLDISNMITAAHHIISGFDVFSKLSSEFTDYLSYY